MTSYDLIKAARQNQASLSVESLNEAVEDQSRVLGAAAAEIAKVESEIYAMKKGEIFIENGDEALGKAIHVFNHERHRLAKLFRWRMNVTAGKLDGGE